MTDLLEEIIQFVKDTSFENNIEQELHLDDIIHSALANEQNELDEEINSNTLQPCNDDKTESVFNMQFLYTYVNNEVEQRDFQKIVDEANNLIIQTSGKKISNISDLFQELLDNTESLPIFQEKQILPLDYIDLYENRIFDAIPNDDFQNSLILNKYQTEQTESKFLKVKINDSLTKRQSVSTCITFKSKILLIGFEDGIIEMFYYNKGIKKTDFESESINKYKERKQVLCLDLCNNDLNIFVAGYMNGCIILWEIKTGKEKLIIQDKESMSSIVNIKFLTKIKKDFLLIASDSIGCVKYYTITQGIFKVNHDWIEIKRSNKVFFLIESFGFLKSETKNTNEMDLQNSLVIIGNIELIDILLANNDEIKSIKVINNSSQEIPDVCFGFGRFKLETNEQSSIVNYSENYLLFVLGWNVNIKFFVIIIKDKQIYDLQTIANIEVDIPIIKIGFLESSMLYIIDKSNQIIILSTLSIIKMEKIQTQKCSSVSREVIQIKETINYNLIEDEQSNKEFTLYYQTIMSDSKKLLIQCKDSFMEIKNYKWEDYLKVLESQGEWEILFSTALDIIEGKVICLKDIPLDNTKRLFIIKKFLKETIESYINAKIDTNSFPNASIIQIIIEVLVNIGEIDFLLSRVKSLIMEKNKNLLEFFYNQLEPYILSDELLIRYSIIKEKQNNELITSENYKENDPFSSMIIDYIFTMKKKYTLSKLLPHYPIEYIVKEKIINYCKDHDFITSLIVIHKELDEKNILLPFIQLFKVFNKAKTLFIFKDSDKRNDPQNIHIYSFVEGKNIPEEVFENSQEYLGHKLLWYINIVLKNQTFPNNDTQFDDETMNILFPELFIWFISNEVLDKLVTFDSYYYFQTLSIFFSEKYIEQIYSISQNFFDSIKTKYNSLFNNIHMSPTTELSSPDLFHIISYIHKNCSKYSNKEIFIKEDLYEFIIKLPRFILCKLENNLLLETITNILAFRSRMRDSNNNTFDKFKCHYRQIFEVPEYTTELSNTYINLVIDLLLIKTNEDKYTQNKILNELITQSENSPYKNVLIFLLQRKKEYKKVVETLIESQLNNNNIDINDEFYVFNYIDKLLQQAKLNEENEVSEIKTHILDSLPSLAQISISDVSNLIEKWFNDKEKEAIDKFNAVPNLQYEFVEKEIEKFVKKINEDRKCFQNQLNDLLIKQIELLITLNNKHLILGKIMEMPDYYCVIDECLTLCRDNDVIDACIFFYIKREQYKQALLMEMKELRNLLERITKNILFLKFDYSDHQVYLLNLEEYIKKCINICELSSAKIANTESNELWIELFDEICRMIKNLSIHIKTSKHIEELHMQLIMHLQDFLKKISCYVNIKEIIERLFLNLEGNIDIKELNKFIRQLMKSFTSVKNILTNVQKIQRKSIMNHLYLHKRTDEMGAYFTLKKCDSCGKAITFRNPKGTFYSFHCGHVTHPYCILLIRKKKERITEITCPACKRRSIGIEEFDNKDNEEQIDMKDEIDEHELEEITHKQRKEYIEKQEKKKRTQLLSKLTFIEKSSFEKNGMLYKDDDYYLY